MGHTSPFPFFPTSSRLTLFKVNKQLSLGLTHTVAMVTELSELRNNSYGQSRTKAVNPSLAKLVKAFLSKLTRINTNQQRVRRRYFLTHFIVTDHGH